MDLEITGGESSLGSGGESSAGSRPNRYELQKLRDWNTFLQYLKNQRPPLSLPSCSGAHVIEFLKLVGQVGQTIIHLTTCAFYGNPIPPAACECPLKLSWGSLDSLIGRLRAAYEESGGPSDSNPFAAKDVQSYLRGVREEQAKARGITYGKKRKQRPSNSAAAASQPEGGATDSSETSTPTTAAPSTSIYGYANLGGRLLLPKTQNPFMPNGKEQSVTYVPVWIRPPDLPVQWWTGSMLSNFASTVGAQEKVSEETGGKGIEEACKAPDPEVGSEEEAHPPPVRRNAKEKITSTEIPKGILKKPGTDTSSNDVITPGEGEGDDPKKPPHASERIVELPPLESAPLVVVRLGASGIEGSRSFSWKDDKIASSILSKIQVHIGNTKLGYPIINKEKFNRELDSLEQKGDKWSDPWFLNLLDDTLMGLPRALRGSEVKASRPCEPRKVRWLKSSGGDSS